MLTDKSRKTEEEAAAAGARPPAATSLAELADARQVVAVIEENVNAKRALFADLEYTFCDENYPRA